MVARAMSHRMDRSARMEQLGSQGSRTSVMGPVGETKVCSIGESMKWGGDFKKKRAFKRPVEGAASAGKQSGRY